MPQMRGLYTLYDVGDAGVDGHYTAFMSGLADATLLAIWTAVVWYYLFFWPLAWSPFYATYNVITPHITIFGIVMLLMLIWSGFVAYSIGLAIYKGYRWQELEKTPLIWVKHGDQIRRLTQLLSNQHSEMDHRTAGGRADEEKSFGKDRGTRFKSASQIGGVILLALALVPVFYAYLYEVIGPAGRMWVEQAHLEGWTAEFLFYIGLVPQLLKIVFILIEEVHYRLGYQFIKGAKTLDARQSLPVLEDMAPGLTYGNDRILHPAYAAKKLEE